MSSFDDSDKNKEKLKQEIIRVKESTCISFEDYLKFFVGLNTQEEYQLYLNQLKKQKLNDFPDLFQVRLPKDKKDTIANTEPLATTNTMYMNIIKYITLQAKTKLYSTTLYDKLLVSDEEQDKSLQALKEIINEYTKTTK